MLRRGVEVNVFDDLPLEPADLFDGRVEIVDLKPQHDAMPRRRRIRVDEIGMLFRIPSATEEATGQRAN